MIKVASDPSLQGVFGNKKWFGTPKPINQSYRGRLLSLNLEIFIQGFMINEQKIKKCFVFVSDYYRLWPRILLLHSIFCSHSLSQANYLKAEEKHNVILSIKQQSFHQIINKSIRKPYHDLPPKEDICEGERDRISVSSLVLGTWSRIVQFEDEAHFIRITPCCCTLGA